MDLAGWVELGPIDIALFAVGWAAGWVMLWRPRPLPAPLSATRRPVAVIVPARNEQAALPALLAPLAAQLRAGDELLVVDDHSDDGTATVAAAHGARVVSPPPLPAGWLGKPHACWHGVAATSAPTLLFLDADVRPASDLLDRIGPLVDTTANGSGPGVVSVQPWHATGSWVEQCSLLANTTALMGCGAFTPWGHRRAAGVAFGPVLAADRARYRSAGGHADPRVRTMPTEDIGLARLLGGAELYTGGPDTTFRMYPGGLGELVRGWTRSIAAGARFTTWWMALATLLWMWSLAGGWLASPVLYPLSAVQVWVLGRRAGAVRPTTALAYPLFVAVFALIFVRSVFALAFGRGVAWKGRAVDVRSRPPRAPRS